MFIKFGCSCADLGEIVPRTSWKIMVFDVISKVQVEEIPESKIVVCLLSFYNFVVFSNGVDSSRMGTNGNETNHDKVQYSIDAPEFVDYQVGTEDEDNVKHLVLIELSIRGMKDWSEGVEEGEENPEEKFIERIFAGL